MKRFKSLMLETGMTLGRKTFHRLEDGSDKVLTLAISCQMLKSFCPVSTALFDKFQYVLKNLEEIESFNATKTGKCKHRKII